VGIEGGDVSPLDDDDVPGRGDLRSGLPTEPALQDRTPDDEPGPPQEGAPRESGSLAHRRAR
jgi:hypothetical protein